MLTESARHWAATYAPGDTMRTIITTALVYLVATTALFGLNGAAFHVASITPSGIIGR